jgi:hypothetical protein
MTRRTIVSVGDLATLIPSIRSLCAGNKSPKTIETYGEACRQLVALLAQPAMPTEAATISREHLETFIQHLLERGAQAGIGQVHPHQFSHTLADTSVRQDGNGGAITGLAGWRSRAVLQRHGLSATEARARDARRLGIGKDF